MEEDSASRQPVGLAGPAEEPEGGLYLDRMSRPTAGLKREKEES